MRIDEFNDSRCDNELVFKLGPEDQSFNEGQRERLVQEGCLCLISWTRKFEYLHWAVKVWV
jgi:hypothetical protein